MVIRRIRRRATFEALRRPQRRSKSGLISVAFTRVETRSASSHDAAHPRAGTSGRVPAHGHSGGVEVAYAVGRRVGGAVQRNHLRRQLRVLVAKHHNGLPEGAYMVSAGAGAVGASFDDLDRDVAAALGRLKESVSAPDSSQPARSEGGR